MTGREGRFTPANILIIENFDWVFLHYHLLIMKLSTEKHFLSFLEFKSLTVSASLWLAFFLQLLTFWAVWRWMAIRVWTSGEEV